MDSTSFQCRPLQSNPLREVAWPTVFEYLRAALLRRVGLITRLEVHTKASCYQWAILILRQLFSTGIYDDSHGKVYYSFM